MGAPRDPPPPPPQKNIASNTYYCNIIMIKLTLCGLRRGHKLVFLGNMPPDPPS